MVVQMHSDGQGRHACMEMLAVCLAILLDHPRLGWAAQWSTRMLWLHQFCAR